jgi:hypothetical protein
VRIGSVGCRLVAEFGQGAAPAFAYIYICRLVFRLHESLERHTASHELRWYTTLSTKEKSNRVENNNGYKYAYSKQ